MSLLKPHMPDTENWIFAAGDKALQQFTTVANELEQLTNQAALIDFSHRGLLEISGPERATFLQGLTTNQIMDVQADQSIYSAMLTPQGRFLWDFTIGQAGESLILETEPQQGAKLVKALAFYLMRTKATIKDVSADYGVLAIAGPQATAKVQELFPDCAISDASLGATFLAGGDQRLWRDPRHENFGWRLQVRAENYRSVWEKIAKIIPPAGEIAWENYRIQHGLPRGGKELIPNESIPLESGLLEMNGVSFQKGCFVGQETTARTHHRGTLKKRLFQVTLGGDGSLEAGTEVLTPSEKVAGTITSAICQTGSCHGLAILRLSDVSEGKQLTVSGYKVTARKPDWAGWELS
jgi:tRNA-modifying protein YgfZ